MDEGTSYIRIGLLLHVVTGDCLASYSMPPSFVRSCMFDVRQYRVVLVCRLLCSQFVYVPLRAILWKRVVCLRTRAQHSFTGQTKTGRGSESIQIRGKHILGEYRKAREIRYKRGKREVKGSKDQHRV